ncbi:hypothetical protein [Limnohabitans sp. T6-5]|uniref:hypothetical protein n=1 Tax=Limnohabitans sp. T6-5 TaxID=1100724 RepID=UPI001304BA44|nr:hypothetical protein [Limnohabitans sp. T6-5]
MKKYLARVMVNEQTRSPAMPISPLIKAIDLSWGSVDSMTLEELEDHAEQVLDTLL